MERSCMEGRANFPTWGYKHKINVSFEPKNPLNFNLFFIRRNVEHTTFCWSKDRSFVKSIVPSKWNTNLKETILWLVLCKMTTKKDSFVHVTIPCLYKSSIILSHFTLTFKNKFSVYQPWMKLTIWISDWSFFSKRELGVVREPII